MTASASRTRTAVVLLALCAAPVRGADPAPDPRDPVAVARAVDDLLEGAWRADKVTPAPAADDATFLRRAHLDITGRLPTAARAAAFLADRAADKRAKLVDELLASAHYGTHAARSWRDRMIRPDANMPNPPNPGALTEWLATRFNDGTGWDRIVSDLLTAEGAAQAAPGTFFLLNGDGRGNPLANVTAGSVAKLFMGVNLECAECHKHPFADWTQTDFWGLAAFFGHVNVDGKSAVTENRAARGFKRSITIKTGPGASIVIPDTSFKGVGEVVRARFPGGPELTTGTDGPLRPALAKWLTTKENPYFAAHAANRLWADFFGRALVPAGDDAVPAAHRKAADLLARALVASGFDRKHLIRCVCGTRAYQRASRPARPDGDVPFAQAVPRALAPEVLYEALCAALELPDLTSGQKRGGLTRAAFLGAFTTRPADSDPTDYAYGIPQALALLNQPVFGGGGAIVDRLLKGKGTADEIVDGLYLAALGRRATADERADAAALVARAKTPREGYSAVLWVLLNGNEFVFNH